MIDCSHGRLNREGVHWKLDNKQYSPPLYSRQLCRETKLLSFLPVCVHYIHTDTLKRTHIHTHTHTRYCVPTYNTCTLYWDTLCFCMYVSVCTVCFQPQYIDRAVCVHYNLNIFPDQSPLCFWCRGTPYTVFNLSLWDKTGWDKNSSYFRPRAEWQVLLFDLMTHAKVCLLEGGEKEMEKSFEVRQKRAPVWKDWIENRHS